MKNKIISIIKVILLQSSMISFGILLVSGIVMAITHNYGEVESISYLYPLGIAICSILCGCAILIFYIQKLPFILQCVLHFLLIVGIVTGSAFLFHWFDIIWDYIIVYGILLVVYVAIWAFTYRGAKKNADEINEALKNNQDED